MKLYEDVTAGTFFLAISACGSAFTYNKMEYGIIREHHTVLEYTGRIKYCKFLLPTEIRVFRVPSELVPYLSPDTNYPPECTVLKIDVMSSDVEKLTVQNLLEDHFRDIECKRCLEVNCEGIVKFTKLPEICIIEVYRSLDSSNKSSKQVEITPSIDLQDMVADTVQLPDGIFPMAANSFLFHISAVVYHSGKNLEEGNFYAVVYDRMHKFWIRCNDIHVKKATEAGLNGTMAQKNVCILFYTHSSKSSIPIFAPPRGNVPVPKHKFRFTEKGFEITVPRHTTLRGRYSNNAGGQDEETPNNSSTVVHSSSSSGNNGQGNSHRSATSPPNSSSDRSEERPNTLAPSLPQTTSSSSSSSKSSTANSHMGATSPPVSANNEDEFNPEVLAFPPIHITIVGNSASYQAATFQCLVRMLNFSGITEVVSAKGLTQHLQLLVRSMLDEDHFETQELVKQTHLAINQMCDATWPSSQEVDVRYYLRDILKCLNESFPCFDASFEFQTTTTLPCPLCGAKSVKSEHLIPLPRASIDDRFIQLFMSQFDQKTKLCKCGNQFASSTKVQRFPKVLTIYLQRDEVVKLLPDCLVFEGYLCPTANQTEYRMHCALLLEKSTGKYYAGIQEEVLGDKWMVFAEEGITLDDKIKLNEIVCLFYFKL